MSKILSLEGLAKIVFDIKRDFSTKKYVDDAVLRAEITGGEVEEATDDEIVEVFNEN